MSIATFGALAGLFIAVILILKKFQPVYSLILGALLGGLIGGANLTSTIDFMINGAKDISPSVLRVLSSGFLAACLIKTGAVNRISEEIVKILGDKHSILGIILSTFVLAAVGVNLDVAVITVAPIGLSLGKKLEYSKMAILLALLGGGKAGNIISPNPNTLAAADNFNANLSSVMISNTIPAFFGIIVTLNLAKFLADKGSKINFDNSNDKQVQLPSLFASLIGPGVSILLLSLGNVININVDPLVALPIGAIIGIIATGNIKRTNEFLVFGIDKMQGICLLLLGTGTLVGIIQASNLQQSTIDLLNLLSIPQFLLAPISGMIMSMATASSTAGSTIASSTFSSAILASGLSGIAGAALVNVGSSLFEQLPHGSLFHTSGSSVEIDLSERFKLLPYEILIGFAMIVVSTTIQLISL